MDSTHDQKKARRDSIWPQRVEDRVQGLKIVPSNGVDNMILRDEWIVPVHIAHSNPRPSRIRPVEIRARSVNDEVRRGLDMVWLIPPKPTDRNGIHNVRKRNNLDRRERQMIPEPCGTLPDKVASLQQCQSCEYRVRLALCLDFFL